MIHRAPWLLFAAALGGAVAASCSVVHGASVSSSHHNTASSGGAGGEAPYDAGDNGETGRSIFEASVQPGLMAECGACHQLTGVADAPFLAQPDIYESITTYRGVVKQNADDSILMIHPGTGTHAIDFSPALRGATRDWLAFESQHLPVIDAGANAYITPFKLYLQGAFNAVYLDQLGPDLANASITFNAEELPQGSSNPTLLMLTNLEVHPIAGKSLHLVHPLFTIYPSSGGAIPDPADSFSGLDQTFAFDGDPTLGTGTLILSQWKKGSRLGIAFEKIEAIITSTTGAPCKDVAKFQAEVVPQLQNWTCASQCHGGTNIAAQQMMDLSNLAAMPPDDACSQVRARIVPGNPDQSQILIVTDPTQQAVHLFKFAGNKNKYNTFKAAVTPWILAEQ
jgi:hypothetical protein